jgi:two-component system chemotaxis sensor kinase CheA
LKETLSKTGEVISTEPSVNKDRPGKVNFRILYASHQTPDIPAVTVSVVAPTTTNTFEHQIPVLESAFEKFAAELRKISVDDVLAQALRAGEAAAQMTGKHVDFEVRGDASLLNQRIADPLLHLVRNAVDHGIETRGKVTIEIAQRDDRISITVTDDGRGIDPSVIKKIFEPGFSTAREVSELSGRGVGLDVVKTTVEELGGCVNVRSTPGQGASFELTLPIRSA